MVAPCLTPVDPGYHQDFCNDTNLAYLAVSANRFLAFLAGIGIKVFIAFHAVGAVLPQDVLLTKEGLFAVVAVKAFSHVGVWSPAILSRRQK